MQRFLCSFKIFPSLYVVPRRRGLVDTKGGLVLYKRCLSFPKQNETSESATFASN